MFPIDVVFQNTVLYLFFLYLPTYIVLKILNQRSKWDTFTRIISTFNALQCTYMVFIVVKNELLRPDIFSIYYPPTDYYTNTLFIFAGYLFVDGLFCLPDLYTDFSFGLILSILHHVIGGYGIYLIADTKLGFFLGFYFAMTEISTPFLNLSWYYRNTSQEENYRKDVFFNLFYVFFFMYRIVTIPILLKYLSENAIEINKLDPLRVFMSFYASYTLIFLNIIWFLFITQKWFALQKVVKINK
jgi:hypothetical protein